MAPFPHLVIHNALPWTLYRQLEESRPAPSFFANGRDLGSNLRMDRHAVECLDNPDVPLIWQDFIRHHTSHKFWQQEVVPLFGDVIKLLYPHLEFEKCLNDYRTGLRFKDSFKDKRADVLLECQPGVNTPPREESRVRGPHLDNPIELLAGLLYMRPALDVYRGGALEVKQLVKPYRCHDKAEIKDEYVKTVATVPYQANTFVMFVNCPTAIHSVTSRPKNPAFRQLVNFAMEVPKPLFNLPR